MMNQAKADATAVDLTGTAKPRVGFLDTRTYQELGPLQLPSKLRDRINKAQRRAAAEKDGVSIFTANVSVSFLAEDREATRTSPRSRTSGNSVGRSGLKGSQRRRESQAQAVAEIATPDMMASKEKMHLPDVIISHKMREFEAKMNLNALFVDPLENNLHHLSIDDKEKVMLRMQEKIQAIIAQIDVHFVQIKEALDKNGIFDSAANSQRAQALCLVELQKRCKLEKLRDEAMREVLDENGGASHAAMSQMEGKLNDLLAHNYRTSREQVDTSAQVAFSHLQMGTKCFTLKRRPAVAKRTLSPVKRKQQQPSKSSNQLNHDSNSSGVGGTRATPVTEATLFTTTVSTIPPTEDWTSRHPHIVHVLQLLTVNGGASVSAALSNDALDVCSSRGGRLDSSSADSTPTKTGNRLHSLAEEWSERSSSYHIIADRTLQELQQRWARWRWDSTNQFHVSDSNPSRPTAIVLPEALQRRLQRQRDTASARLRDEEERQRRAVREETNADKLKKAEAVYQQLQHGIQWKRQEREKRLQGAPKRLMTASSRTSRTSSMERVSEIKRAATSDGRNPSAKTNGSIFDREQSANSSDQTRVEVSDDRKNQCPPAGVTESAPTRRSLAISASAPLLGERDTKNEPQNAFPRGDSRRAIHDRTLPILSHQVNRRSRVRGDTLIGGQTFMDLNTLGHYSNSRIEERRNSAQTWAWHHPQKSRLRSMGPRLVPQDERSEGDEEDDLDSDVDASERRDGLGAISSDEDDVNSDDESCDSQGDSGDDRKNGDDTRSVRSSISSFYPMDSARSSFSIVSKTAVQLGDDASGIRRRGKGHSKKALKCGGIHGRHQSSLSKRASPTLHGPRGSRLLSRASNGSNTNGSGGGTFAGIHFTANAQVLQHRFENLWQALDFPFSSKLVMLEKYATLEDADAFSRALTHWEAAVDIVLLREKLKHILVEFEEVGDVKASTRLIQSEWSFLLMQQIDIPPNAVNLSLKELVEWTQLHFEAVTLRCEKMAQQVKANTGDELIFQGYRYPPRG